jgi:adenylosuccinate synthase
MTNHIVIGANFGDEGKGLVTDYLANKLDNNIVIRFNGGAQAAHTVELLDGRRHVFHHVGSGTLRGSPTLLSEHFIHNPRVFIDEYFMVPAEYPKVLVHRDGLLSTPYDWYLNWYNEDTKGHGTCGMGINETVTRTVAGYKITIDEIFNIPKLRQKLKHIEDSYVPKRAKEKNINLNELDFNIDTFLEDCELMSKLIIPVSNYNILKHFKNRIFEGAQGLLLDEFHYYFPHVTRSRTGVTNAVDILNEIKEVEAEVHYTTRTYLTRHGNGPLLLEGGVKSKHDETNKHNDSQGILRFANLNLPLIHESISNDIHKANFKLTPSLAVTWGNHIEDIKNVNDYNYGEDLNIELETRFPSFQQTWFMDRYAESAEPK